MLLWSLDWFFLGEAECSFPADLADQLVEWSLVWGGLIEDQRKEGKMVREEQEERYVSHVCWVVGWGWSDLKV